ncbi:MAG: hypothetical protein HRU20_15815 [Pseudomonadales bacterium]|nr:hypothetical protein [Pseudomonadales bacterium]
MVAPSNPNQINIVISVDVLRALSEETLKGSLHMMDNNPFGIGKESIGQGTDYLTTSCVPGQVLHWQIFAVDVQTPVSIKKITFLHDGREPEPHAVDSSNSRPDLKVWTGTVPQGMILNQLYHYKLEVQMGKGPNSIMYTDTAALKRV